MSWDEQLETGAKRNRARTKNAEMGLPNEPMLYQRADRTGFILDIRPQHS